jgi:hypothetical protein
MRALSILTTLLIAVGSSRELSAQGSIASSLQASVRAVGERSPNGARPDDMASLDAIIAALYDVISGPAGQQRDWDRMRGLFAPGARLIPTVYRPDSVPSVRVWDPDQYIATVGPRLESGGFFEREIARRTERYGGVVHVFSTYESRRAAADPAPFARGINSIQAFFDGKRWWIVTIYWEGERSGNPIPTRYLETPGQ